MLIGPADTGATNERILRTATSDVAIFLITSPPLHEISLIFTMYAF